MKFSILTINTRDQVPPLDVINISVRNAIMNTLPIQFIDYSAFKKNTESKPVPLYILNRKNTERGTNIQDIQTMKRVFDTGPMIANYTAPVDQSFNPRFMVMDVHDIKVLKCREAFAVRINVSNVIPISMAKVLTEISIGLSGSTPGICSVFVVGSELNQEVEYTCRTENGRIVKKLAGPVNSGVIGKYTSDRRISINQIMATMDLNIEKLMAPHDVAEMEAMLAALTTSQAFMGQNNLTETQEYMSNRTQINEVQNELQNCRNLAKQEPDVISSYMKIYDPRQLEKFKVEHIQFEHQKINRKEWKQ